MLCGKPITYKRWGVPNLQGEEQPLRRRAIRSSRGDHLSRPAAGQTGERWRGGRPIPAHRAAGDVLLSGVRPLPGSDTAPDWAAGKRHADTILAAGHWPHLRIPALAHRATPTHHQGEPTMTIKVRLSGEPDEITCLAEHLRDHFEVAGSDRAYPNRGSFGVRVYLELREHTHQSRRQRVRNERVHPDRREVEP